MNSKTSSTDDNRDDQGHPNIWNWFEQLCFSFGDQDAIQIQTIDTEKQDGVGPSTPASSSSLCYFEILEYAKSLASQLHWRYRPSYVLIDCHGWAGAETTVMLACIRIQVPFVPVSCYNQHAAEGCLETIVKQLLNASEPNASVVAITCCRDDQDPVLGVFQKANVHSIVFVDECGNLREALPVPAELPPMIPERDDLYVLFTSGTSGKNPKAVIGSHQSTLKRIKWFHDTNVQLPKVAKRTPLTFVDSIAELLGTLLAQQSILVSLPGGPNSTQLMDIGDLVWRTQCSQISMLPSQLEQLFLYRQSRPENVASLERIIVSGEPCTESLWYSFRRAFYDSEKGGYLCDLINLYGQTETTADCCGATLTRLPDDKVVVNHTVTIGMPLRSDIAIAGKRFCDDQEQVELKVIGNSCLSNGYLKDTAEAKNFDWDSEANCRSFSTGDTGFCRDGLWYVQGRIDEVMKINGEWVSPSAVESAFLSYTRQQESTKSPPVAVVATVVNGKIYLLQEKSYNQQKNDFSREEMKIKTQLSWNKIPHQVFDCRTLPKTAGTGKVDRAQVKKIVESKTNKDTNDQDLMLTTNAWTRDSLLILFQRILAEVLNHSEVDLSKSFVDLGGESASAVSLQYELRLRWWPKYNEQISTTCNDQPLFLLSPLDILNCSKASELFHILIHEKEEKRRAKRARSDGIVTRLVFRPESRSVWNSFHSSIQFAACVDITPVLVNDSEGGTCVLAGCQNGAFQTIHCGGLEVKTRQHCYFHGYRVSSDLEVANDRIFACMIRHPKSSELLSGAKIVEFTKKLAIDRWTRELSPNQSIVSSPIFHNDRLWVVVLSAHESLRSHCLTVFDPHPEGIIETGQLPIPVSVVANPLVWNLSPVRRSDGTCATALLIYASSDWDTGLVLVDVERESLLSKEGSYLFFSGEIGPVYKRMELCAKDNTIILSDSWGSIHKINLCTMAVSSRKVANCTLSSPSVCGRSWIVVGGYDGWVHCISIDLSNVLWSYNVKSTVYTRPLPLSDGSNVVVCTTAGDVRVLNLDTGISEWDYRLPVGVEVWSDPIELSFTCQPCSLPSRRICFGARDSRLHFINLPTPKDESH